MRPRRSRPPGPVPAAILTGLSPAARTNAAARPVPCGPAAGLVTPIPLPQLVLKGNGHVRIRALTGGGVLPSGSNNGTRQ